MRRPLSHVPGIGSQIGWVKAYLKSGWPQEGRWLGVDDLAVTKTAQLSKVIADTFYGDGFDLSARENAVAGTWSEMPEVRAVRHLRDVHASDREVRLFLTLVTAVDRARDANRLWRTATDLYRSSPDLFEPTQVAHMRLSDLREVLSSTKVS